MSSLPEANISLSQASIYSPRVWHRLLKKLLDKPALLAVYVTLLGNKDTKVGGSAICCIDGPAQGDAR
jgi:hypothetical protein